ncbi:ArsR family transcriptional regulator [Deinobacterium chartae]|uniref:ArsR family transcriptional regulator n=1 Tax=Deinobacterium chartae TaxID=521158 RepID=A0A841HYR0_9DEIO|nr:metalloregulator ArsR/SmtB family transcription factor [Deinobacterium chartae]MBB6097360.1 ArsR family transcriptional regulator [Deinobacterium chartae]
MRLEETADVFKALGDEHRLKILHFLATRDPACCSTGAGICGCDLQDLTGLAQPTVSHHMKLLLSAGLVTGEKRGKWTYYTLSARGLEVARQGIAFLLSHAPQAAQEAV